MHITRVLFVKQTLPTLGIIFQSSFYANSQESKSDQSFETNAKIMQNRSQWSPPREETDTVLISRALTHLLLRITN